MKRLVFFLNCFFPCYSQEVSWIFYMGGQESDFFWRGWALSSLQLPSSSFPDFFFLPPGGLSGGYNQDSRISDVHPAPKRTKGRLLWVCSLGIRTASGWGAWVLREEAEIWYLSFHWKQVVCSAVLGVLGWVGRLLGWGLPPAPTPQHRGLLTRCPVAHLGCKQPAAERRFHRIWGALNCIADEGSRQLRVGGNKTLHFSLFVF